jgi:hypothetical protein
MQNKAKFQKSQIFITVVSTTNYSEKPTVDTWSKQTQTKPTCGEQSRTTCSELARPERGRRVEPILSDSSRLSDLLIFRLTWQHEFTIFMRDSAF